MVSRPAAWLLLAAALLAAPALAQERPDPALSPGEARTTDLVVICGTSTREFRHTTEAMKRRVYRAYGLSGPHTGYCSIGVRGCEVDHLISLELGGADTEKNLWPQSYSPAFKWNAVVKDRLENETHRRVCDEAVGIEVRQRLLLEYQERIAADWVSLYVEVFGGAPD